MLKVFYSIITATVLFPSVACSQLKSKEDSFSNIVFVTKGDLNKDNIADSVVVLQDTLNDISPYRLKIFLSNANRKYSLSVQSDSAIGPQFPDGKEGYSNPSSFIDITIESGILSINCEFNRGHYEHKFRYQNKSFELIGFTQSYLDGEGIMYTTDYNLSTGVFLESKERFDTGKLLSKKRKVIKVKNLSKMENFSPFLTDIY